MFERIEKMLSKDEVDRLKNINVLLVGLGGVGGYALEMLVRSGIQNITIIDADIIDISNLNRQIISLQSNIGCDKVNVAKKRCRDINPDVNIEEINVFLTKDNMAILDDKCFDYIIDACDTITAKIELIKYAFKNNSTIISCMGTGNKLDPSKLEIIEIKKTSYDPLARVMRSLLKKEDITNDVMCVCSRENPRKNENRTPASMALVPATAGILCASFVINEAIKQKVEKP